MSRTTRVVRRLFRIAVSGVCLLSLLASVEAAVLWVRSYWRFDAVISGKTDPQAARPHAGNRMLACRLFETNCGQVAAGTVWVGDGQVSWLHEGQYAHTLPARGRLAGTATVWGRVGLGYVNVPGRLRLVVVPCWLVVLIAASPPVLRLVLVVRRQGRHVQGFCDHCGYDLRASEARCPECGNPITGLPT